MCLGTRKDNQFYLTYKPPTEQQAGNKFSFCSVSESEAGAAKLLLQICSIYQFSLLIIIVFQHVPSVKKVKHQMLFRARTYINEDH